MSPKLNLPKKERLSTAQFKPVFKNGKRFSHKDCLVVFAKNNLGINRLGIALPKAKIRLSSTRNRSRRLLKEAYRLNKGGIKPGNDVVIILNKPISDFYKAQEMILYLFGRLDKK